MRNFLYSLPVALMMTACASSDSDRYMAANEQGDYGYYESALEDDRYRVAYKTRGNDVEEAKDFALLRAAELTLQKGYDWFEVVDRDAQTENRGSHDRAVASMRLNATTYRECGILSCRNVTRPAYIDPTYRDRAPQGVESTATIIEIVMGEGEKPSGNIYDARTLAETIRNRS